MWSSIKLAIAFTTEWLYIRSVSLCYRCFRGTNASATVEYEDVDIGAVQARSSAADVPKIIWAFWNGPMSPFVSRCLQAFREKNPGYLVVLMNRKNAKRYTTVDLTAYPRMNDSVKRLSDAVRLHVLAAYGGFWLDASIIVQRPLDLFVDKMTKAKAEFFGYTIYSPIHAPGEYSNAAIVESWFLVSRKGSPFMQAWRDEFMRINTFKSVRAYVHSVEAEGVDLTGMKENGLGVVYLAIHVAAKRVMAFGPGKYRLCLERSEDAPYKFEFDHRWSHRKALKAVATGKYKDLPVLKLNGFARNVAEWWKDPSVFFN
jgi:hypothetical protein